VPAQTGQALAVLLAAALAVAVAAVAVVTTLRGGDSGLRLVADAVAAVDPESDELVGSVAVAAQPAAVAAVGRDVWVTSFREGTVVRVDATTLRVRGRLRLTEPPGGIAAGARALWVRTEEAVLRIDPVHGRVAATIRLPTSAGLAVAAGGGAVWAVAGTRLYRIDPARNRIAATIDLAPQRLVGVRFAEGAVWVNGPRRPAIVRVDPETHARRQYRVAGRVGSWDAGFGSLWVGKPAQAAVARIDIATGREVASIPVGPDPRGLAAGTGAVWVAADDGLWRIDPGTNAADHLDLHGAPAASLAAPFPAAGRIWVTVW
jgi:DNA-binding beta-propeller fold protein YncE